MKRSKIKTLLYLFYLAFLVHLITTAIGIISYGLKQEKYESDIAIVLGAAAWGDEVSPVFRERINHGIWLYREGYVEKILFTGGKAEGNTHSDAYVAMQYALSQGVPAEAILLEEESTITMENIDNAKAIMESMGYSSATIVSDPLHMKRALFLANRERNNMIFRTWPTPTTMYRSLNTQLPFWIRETFLYLGHQLYEVFSW